MKLCVTVNLSLSASLSLRAASSTSSADNVPIAWSCSLSRSFCSADTSARQADSFNQHKTTVSSAHHLPTDREIYLNIHNDNKAVVQSALQAPAPVIHMVHYCYRYTHAHTHTFNLPFPGLPGWAGTRKVKPIWILLKQETVSGGGISWAICKSAPRSRQNNHASTSPLSLMFNALFEKILMCSTYAFSVLTLVFGNGNVCWLLTYTVSTLQSPKDLLEWKFLANQDKLENLRVRSHQPF